MTEADTLTYYSKLAALRASQPAVPGVNFAVRQCDAKISGDAIYTYRCPAAWLEYVGAPTTATAELVFPRKYFLWLQAYLKQALSNRPYAHSSAEFRVVWALDVWAHVNYGLFALPFPWSDIFSGGVGGVDELALRAVALTGAQASTGREVSAWSLAKAQQTSTASTRAIRETIAASRLNPAPFSELVVQWVGAPGSRSALFQKPNPIWPLLLVAMQPWSSTWASHWLGSRGDKDAGDVARWRNEPVLLRAAMQWRLVSVQDWGYSGPDPSYWPQGMGRATSVSTLGAYIRHVAGEATAPKIDFIGTGAFPNLAFGLDAVAEHASRVAAIDFDVVLQQHLDMWLAHAAPRLAANGSLLLRPDGSITRQPITRTDYADYFKGLRKAVTDRMRLALANPALSCSPSDAACLKAAEYGVKFQAAVQSSPLAPVQNTIQRVADKLAAMLGGAVGGGYEPLFVLRDPFCRSFGAAGYRLVADGSTADVFYRIAVAVEHYKQLVPGIFAVRGPRVAKYASKIYWTRDGDACEIREDRPRPPCAANVPNLPPPAPAQSEAERLSQVCDAFWAQLLSNTADPYVRQCLSTPVHKQVFDNLCLAMASQQVTLADATTQWANYVARVCAPPKRGFMAALADGFLRSSNPLR